MAREADLRSKLRPHKGDLISVGEPPRVLSDYQVFIRGDHPGGCPASGHCDDGRARRIRRLIKLDAKPGSLFAHATANIGCVLADAPCEYECVQTAETGGKRSQFSTDSVNE